MSLSILTRYGLSQAPPGGGGGAVLTGILSSTTYDASVSLSHQVGWAFDVGATDLEVVALRVYVGAANPETIRLWRTSDQALIASAGVTTVTDTWVEAAITPVTLAAGARYAVTTRRPSGSDPRLTRYRGSPNDTFVAADYLSYATGVAVDADSYPTGANSRLYFADIAFVEP